MAIVCKSRPNVMKFIQLPSTNHLTGKSHLHPFLLVTRLARGSEQTNPIIDHCNSLFLPRLRGGFKALGEHGSGEKGCQLLTVARKVADQHEIAR
jgi:hypothetical protein